MKVFAHWMCYCAAVRDLFVRKIIDIGIFTNPIIGYWLTR